MKSAAPITEPATRFAAATKEAKSLWRLGLSPSFCVDLCGSVALSSRRENPQGRRRGWRAAT